MEEIPWITYNATEWLKTYLKPDMLVFEYGSGSSTIFFSKLVNKVISVEHDERWYKKIKELLADKNILNVDYLLRVPNKTTRTQEYVNSINNYPDKYFDFVLVDGLERTDSAINAVGKIKPGGYIMLDDSERKQYSHAVRFLNRYHIKTEFFGKKPRQLLKGSTTVWKIR